MYSVLLVDDEPLTGEGLKDFITWEEFGFTILDSVLNGSTAMGILVLNACHLVITDVRMPVMDGISLTRQIKETFPDIQVIILSGYRDFEYAQKAMEYGACGYLLKPVQKNELTEMLDKVRKILKDMAYAKNWGSKSSYFQVEGEDLAFDWDDNRVVEAVLSSDTFSIERELSSFISSLYSMKDGDGESLPSYQKRFALLKYISKFDPILSSKGENLFEVIPTRTFWNLLNGINDPTETKKALSGLISLFGEAVVRHGQLSCVELLPNILEYVKGNLDKEITLKSIASMFYVSPVYLGKIFKREINVAFNDYLHMQRIEKIKSLVGLPDIPVSEIMHRTGYKNPEYFYKMFKKYEGVSFSEYRKQARRI